jgi:hypothetical protein
MKYIAVGVNAQRQNFPTLAGYVVEYFGLRLPYSILALLILDVPLGTGMRRVGIG